MNLFGAWGLLPLAFPLLALVVAVLVVWLFPSAGTSERAAGAVVLAMAVVQVSVVVLGVFEALSGPALLAFLALLGPVLVIAVKPRFRWGSPKPGILWASLAIAVPVVLAVVSARILPVWQWDALGYHLPFVHFVLQSGGFQEVPRDLNYISTYPHNIELGMVWLRAMLPDERLVDLAQIPYGLGGAVLVAASARKLGARPVASIAAGAAWLVCPGVFLQLPTNYVDVGTATTLLGAIFFLILSPSSTTNLLIGGIALGLFLGSEASAPMAVAFIAVVVLIRAIRSGQWLALAGWAIVTLAFGAEMYVLMLIRHGNPVWPVVVHVGPWTLPGEVGIGELFASAADVPRAQGNFLERLTLSWLAVGTQPVFDMRLGGFGLLLLFALPLAIVALVSRRGGWALIALVASLCTPEPSTTRYVLAFGGLLFALASVVIDRAPKPARVAAAVGAVLLGIFQLSVAMPALVGDGPSWAQFWTMGESERNVALGPFGSTEEYARARAQVRNDESVAFDRRFEFPGLLWSGKGRYPVRVVPEFDPSMLPGWLEAHRVKVFAAGPSTQSVVEDDPMHWEKLFDCKSAPCAVYVRRDQ